MYTCIYIFMYIYLIIYLFIKIYIYIFIHKYIYIYICIHIYSPGRSGSASHCRWSWSDRWRWGWFWPAADWLQPDWGNKRKVTERSQRSHRGHIEVTEVNMEVTWREVRGLTSNKFVSVIKSADEKPHCYEATCEKFDGHNNCATCGSGAAT